MAPSSSSTSSQKAKSKKRRKVADVQPITPRTPAQQAKDRVVVQRFLVALDSAIISSEFIGGKDLFHLSTTCHGASSIVRLKALAIGGPPRVLQQLPRFPSARQLAIRFTRSQSSGGLSTWIIPSQVEKLRAQFQALCESKLQSLSLCFQHDSAKKGRKYETAIADPYSIFLPGLVCAPHLTRLSFCDKGIITPASSTHTPLRVFTEGTFPNLVSLTILGGHTMTTLATMLLPAIERNAIPRLQIITLKSLPLPVVAEPVTRLIRYLADDSHLEDLKRVSLLGSDLGLLSNGNSVMRCLRMHKTCVSISSSPLSLRGRRS